MELTSCLKGTEWQQGGISTTKITWVMQKYYLSWRGNSEVCSVESVYTQGQKYFSRRCFMKIRTLFSPVKIVALVGLLSIFGIHSRENTAQESTVDRTHPLGKLKAEFGLADGAAWDGKSWLYIPDVKNQTLTRWNPKMKKLQVVNQKIGRISATFFQHGRLYLSDNGEQNISFLKRVEKKVICSLKQDPDSKLRPNDLVVDKNGGIYVTFTPQNQVHYIAANGDRHVAVQGIATPNGITLSPDEKTLYVSAYVPKQIWKYEVLSPGKLGVGIKFSDLPQSDGRGADGMAMDRIGNVYCTGPTGVTIWDTNGQLLDRIVTPSKPINCIFGDQDMQTLYISCMDGVYFQRMKVSGKFPQPPIDDDTTLPKSKDVPSPVPTKKLLTDLDVVYARYGNRRMLMDIVRPATEGAKAAILVVHGGGWLKGDKTKFRALSIELANNGYVVAALEYRLGGERRFPAGIQDCYAAVRFLRAEAKRFDIDPRRIGAVGGSAGGHLVGLLAAGGENRELTGKEDRGEPSSLISAAIVMAGPMQMVTGSVAARSRTVATSNANVWLGKTVDEAKDLYLLADAYEQLSNDTPPILFMTGEFDNPDRNLPSREKLNSLGVWTGLKVYKDGKHGCWNRQPWFDDMTKDMVDFFDQQLVEQKISN